CVLGVVSFFASLSSLLFESSFLLLRIVVDFPNIASSKVKSITYCRSSPCLGAFGLREALLPPPPKNWSKISSKPENESPPPKPPNPPPLTLGSVDACPNQSYVENLF